MECAYVTCDRPSRRNKLCATHAAQQRRGRPLTDIRDKKSGVGRWVSTDGYIVLSKPNHPNAGAGGRLYEHRFVMAEKIGRPLLPTEQVHHINGNRQDNRPENLELWASNQPVGARVEDLVKWAKEILEVYGDDSNVWRV